MKKRMKLVEIHTLVAERKKSTLEKAFPFFVTNKLKPSPLDLFKVTGIIDNRPQLDLNGNIIVVPYYDTMYILNNSRQTLDGHQLFYLKSMKDDEINMGKYMESWLNEHNK